MTEQAVNHDLFEFSQRLTAKALDFFARGVDIRSEPSSETGIEVVISYDACHVSHRFEKSITSDGMIARAFEAMARELGRLVFTKRE